MRNLAGESLVTTARVFFLGVIVYAAAAYGLTRESTIQTFQDAMAVVGLLWGAGHLVAGRLPRVPVLAALLLVGILLTGWTSYGLSWLNENGPATDDFPQPLATWVFFGAYDLFLAEEAMVRFAALAVAFLVMVDLLASTSWGRTTLLVYAATILGTVVFFYLQRIFGEPFLLTSERSNRIILSFATYRYWGNAASFLNLGWPLFAAFAAHTLMGHRARGWLFWIAATILVFAAVFLNKSKAGHILGPLGLIVFLIAIVVRQIRRNGFGSFRISPTLLVGAGLPLVIIVGSLVYAIPADRWKQLAETSADENSRLVAYKYFLQMVPDAGWLGFGPGSFKEAYWGYAGDDPIVQRTPFWVAHQDYLQTVAEWGYAGTAFWAVFFIIPVSKLIRRLGGRNRLPDQRDEYCATWRDHLDLFWRALPEPTSPILATGALVAIGLTALHAAVDFPMQIVSIQLYFLLWIALGWNAPPPGSLRCRDDPDESD